METRKSFCGPSVVTVASDPRTSARALTLDNFAESRTDHATRMRLSELPEIRYWPAERSILIRPLGTNDRSREFDVAES